MKTQDWVETSVLLDNDICPTISASGVSLLIIIIKIYVEVMCVMTVMLLY